MRRLPHAFWRRPLTATLRIATSVWLLRRGRTLVPARVGDVRLCVDLRTPTGLFLFRYGFDGPELDCIIGLLNPGDTFVDCGANVGLFAVPAAARVAPHGHVHAFEPVPQQLECMARSRALNSLPNLSLHALALSEVQEDRDFFVAPFGGGTSSFASDATQAQRIRVRTSPLDDLFSADEMSRIRLVKIDVEGAEAGVLRGARRLIERRTATFLVEVEPAHLRRMGSAPSEIFQIFENAGYECDRVGSENYLFSIRAESSTIS